MKKPSIRNVKKLLPHEGIVYHAEEFGLGTVGIAKISENLEERIGWSLW